MIFGVLNPEKMALTAVLVHLPTSPVYCSHFDLGNPNSLFSTVLFIHTSDYLRYLRRKQTVTPLASHLINVTALPTHDTDELQKRLVATWAEFQQSVVDDAVDQWRKRLEGCIRAEGGHFKHLL